MKIKRNKKLFLLIAISLASILFISGCSKNKDVENISDEEIEDVSKSEEELDLEDSEKNDDSKEELTPKDKEEEAEEKIVSLGYDAEVKVVEALGEMEDIQMSDSKAIENHKNNKDGITIELDMEIFTDGKNSKNKMEEASEKIANEFKELEDISYLIINWNDPEEEKDMGIVKYKIFKDKIELEDSKIK